MLKGIHTSASGMIPQARKQEVIANNVANATTPGYKADRLFTKELTDAVAKQRPTKSPWEQPMLDRTYIDFAPGSFDQTGNQLDLAIDGDGFFQLQDAEGNLFLTRSGHFTVDSEGYIAHPEGLRLIGQGGPVAAGNGQISIDPDGTVQVEGRTVDQIIPVQVDDLAQLQKIGSSLFQMDQGQELAASTTSQIRQGYLETANVNIVEEMVEMIVTYREYEANAKSMTTQDKTLDHLFRRVAGDE